MCVEIRSVISKEGVISTPRSQKRGFQTTFIHHGESECKERNMNVACRAKIKSASAESNPDEDPNGIVLPIDILLQRHLFLQ